MVTFRRSHLHRRKCHKADGSEELMGDTWGNTSGIYTDLQISPHQATSFKMKFLLMRTWWDTPTTSIPLPMLSVTGKTSRFKVCVDLDIPTKKMAVFSYKFISSNQKLNYHPAYMFTTPISQRFSDNLHSAAIAPIPALTTAINCDALVTSVTSMCWL